MLRTAPRIHVAEIGSTSDEARRLLRAGELATPFVIRADRQLAGRGRQGRTWWSDPGCLTATVALDPAAIGLTPTYWPRVALAAAVAIVDALEPPLIAGTLGIRWPNDVEASGRKLAGLLPEIVPSPAGPRLALGIGVNVAPDLAAAPPQIRAMATSVEILLGRRLSLKEVLDRILIGLERTLGALASDSPSLVTRWQGLDALRGETVRIDRGESILEGQSVGVDGLGRLLVNVGGEVQAVAGGQVLREPPR